jgi:N-acetylglucosaminyldiphosphoundecaprenol N-acetyl-beta-D-mannosaminyltransferase
LCCGGITAVWAFEPGDAGNRICRVGTTLALGVCMMLAQGLSLPSRISVDDLKFDKLSMKEAVRRILRMAKKHDRARYVCTGNLDHLVLARRDPDFRDVYKKADLVVADGAPIVWLSRIASSAALSERVTGSDLFWELARLSGEANLRLFFLGGVPGSAAKAAEAVQSRHPGANVVGTYCPPVDCFDTKAEQERIRRVVRQAAPDVLLVAFGAPKQEKWIVAHKDELGVPVSIGVGGSFELAAGIRRRAPRWLQRSGLEWLYRFALEPKRLFRRYFVNDLPYLAGAVARAVLARIGIGAGCSDDEMERANRPLALHGSKGQACAVRRVGPARAKVMKTFASSNPG